MCLHFLWLLASSSSLLAHALPTLGSANSVDTVNSKTIGAMNRMKSDTVSNPKSEELTSLDFLHLLLFCYYYLKEVLG